MAAAAVLVPLVLIDVWLGGWWFIAALVLAGCLMAREWVTIVYGGDRGQMAIHVLCGALAAPVTFELGLVAVAILTVAGWLAALTLTVVQRQTLSLWSLPGIPYLVVPLAAFAVLRQDPQAGLIAVVWLLVAVWSADSMAYFAGRTIGGPKLWPAVSPKKTWAGVFGAMAGAALAGWIVGWVSGMAVLWPLMLLGAVIGVVEQAGDLFESAVKRANDLKDSGTLIPGHGGMLDRVDGLMAAAVVAAGIGLVRGGQDGAGVGFLVW